MGFTLTSDFQLQGDHPSENRVWGFRGVSVSSVRKLAPQVVEAHQENSPTPTKTVSGIPYWLSRDPIAENGGINLYAYVNNDPINWLDFDGLAGSRASEAQKRRNRANLEQLVEQIREGVNAALTAAGKGSGPAASTGTAALKVKGICGQMEAKNQMIDLLTDRGSLDPIDTDETRRLEKMHQEATELSDAIRDALKETGPIPPLPKEGGPK